MLGCPCSEDEVCIWLLLPVCLMRWPVLFAQFAACPRGADFPGKSIPAPAAQSC